MGLDDLLFFDEADYTARVKKMSLSDLKSREVVKYRQTVGAGTSIAGGLAITPWVGPLALLGPAYGSRRLWVAQRKLEIVRAELERRDVANYEPSKRDVFIPMGIGIACMGAGAGLDAVAGEATSTAAAHVVADHGSKAVHDALQCPGSFVEGVVKGATTQAHEVSQLGAGGLQHATSAAALDSSYIISGAPFVNPAEVVGLSAGMSAAQVVETKVAIYASKKIGLRLVDKTTGQKSQPITFAKPPPSCRRMKMEFSSLLCDHCKERIQTGTTTYYHCCSCRSQVNGVVDDYDACEKCIVGLKRGCKERESHVLHKITPTNKPTSCARFADLYVSNAVSALTCNYCKGPISESDYYHCCDCSDDDFDICKPCFDSGRRCYDNKHSMLQLLPEPRKNFWNIINNEVPLTCRRRRRTAGALFTCDPCGQMLNSSEVPFVHCCQCNLDNYDICITCALKGVWCKEVEHILYLIR